VADLFRSFEAPTCCGREAFRDSRFPTRPELDGGMDGCDAPEPGPGHLRNPTYAGAYVRAATSPNAPSTLRQHLHRSVELPRTAGKYHPRPSSRLHQLGQVQRNQRQLAANRSQRGAGRLARAVRCCKAW